MHWVAALLAIGLSAIPARGQAGSSLYQQPVYAWAPDKLDQMLGAIALYPDPLIAQLLPAATQPDQIVAAARYVQSGGDPGAIDSQPWDESVRAIARYPTLIEWLDTNLAWTTQVGQAFLNQPADVSASIQRLRAQAQAYGNLGSTPQEQVVPYDGIIEILPTDPDEIYVPDYDPALVFFQTAVVGRPFITFRLGYHTGLWFNHDFDWFNHRVVVWGRDHPRPPGWWSRPPTERWHGVAGRDSSRPLGREGRGVNEKVTVWQPRGAAAAGFRAPPAARGYETRPVERDPARPGPPSGARERPAVLERSNRLPEREPVRPPPVAERPPLEREPSRPASGALVGVHSAQQTQQYSNRGQQSRGASQGSNRRR